MLPPPASWIHTGVMLLMIILLSSLVSMHSCFSAISGMPIKMLRSRDLRNLESSYSYLLSVSTFIIILSNVVLVRIIIIVRH